MIQPQEMLADPLSELTRAIDRAAAVLPHELIAELRRTASKAPVPPETHQLQLRRGTYRFGAAAVTLPDREFELCAALGWHGAMSGEALCDLLMPDVEPAYAGNRLRAIAHRVRARVAQGCIEFSSGAYRLPAIVQVDVKNDEALVARAARAGALGAEDIAALEDLVQREFLHGAAVVPGWAWFAPVAARIEAIAKDAALLLANHALKCRQIYDAQRIAQLLADRDPYDEAPREVLIRSYLALGARTKAIREYRAYERTLQLELRLPPPEFLRSLVAFR